MKTKPNTVVTETLKSASQFIHLGQEDYSLYKKWMIDNQVDLIRWQYIKNLYQTSTRG